MLRDARIRGRPDWIPPSVWEELQSYWRGERFTKVSSQNKGNRRSEKGGSLHTGGSIPPHEHAMRIEKETGMTPQFFEIFKHTHIRKRDGEEVWVDQRSEKTYADFQAARSSQSTPDEMLTPDSQRTTDVQLWEKCAGGRSFGRIYGLGRQSSSPSVQYPPSDSTDQFVREEMQTLRQENQELREKVGKQGLAIEHLYKLLGEMRSTAPDQPCPPAPAHESDSSSSQSADGGPRE